MRKHPQGALEQGSVAHRAVMGRLQALVDGGVPVEYRAHVWSSLSGARAKMLSKRQYHSALVAAVDGSDTECTRQIDKDLARTFPKHPSVCALKLRLRNMLAALSVHNPSVGYCQGLSYVGAVLLLLMDEECAFWTLVQLVEE